MPNILKKTPAIPLILVACLVVAAIWALHRTPAASATQPSGDNAPAPAQDGPTSTPAPVILPSGTATLEPPTGTPTRTPTEVGPALVEARNPETNVRAGPGIDNDRIGQINPGTRYVVRAKRFEWFRIDFPDAPSGVGWVHQSVVDVIGDPNDIPETNPEDLPTPDLTAAAREETLIAATQTPGGLLTLTAASQVTPEGVFTTTPQIGVEPTLGPGERLPTFTFPAATPTPVPIQDLRGGSASSADEGGLAPIFPIAGLAGLGLMGLFFSILRRL